MQNKIIRKKRRYRAIGGQAETLFPYAKFGLMFKSHRRSARAAVTRFAFHQKKKRKEKRNEENLEKTKEKKIFTSQPEMKSP